MPTLNAAFITINDPLGGKVTTVWGLVSSVLATAIPLASVIFVGMIVYAGFTYMMSSGEVPKVKAAQAMITNAIIGMVIVALAFVIQKVVENAITGV